MYFLEAFDLLRLHGRVAGRYHPLAEQVVGRPMGSLTPIQIALLIVAGVSTAGVIANLIRRGRTLSGYEEIAPEVMRLGKALRAETFRDHMDVVISGSFNGVPAVVRFSNAENTPAVNVRMPAAATFQLSVCHIRAKAREGGRNLIKTGNAAFDARFATRTDQVTVAGLFLHGTATRVLERLACSRNTFLTVGNGAVELSELLLPTPNTGEHILEHLRAMAELGQLLRSMPGSDRIKVATMQRDHHVAVRLAMVVGVAAALASVYTANKTPSTAAPMNVNATVANGIPPAEALLLRDAKSWRVAAADDFDTTVAAWMRGQGQKVAGRITADFSGTGAAHDVAYLLIGPEQRRRIAILANHTSRVDGEMVNAGAIARIPKSAVSRIEWRGGKAPEGILGDGLLVVQRRGDMESAVVFFLSSKGVVSGAPANYQQISFP